MVTYEQACDIAASVFPGNPFSAAHEYPGGWYSNVEDEGWMEGEPTNKFGPSMIVHKSDGEWKYFDVGNPEFHEALSTRKPVALPEKYATIIRPKHNAG